MAALQRRADPLCPSAELLERLHRLPRKERVKAKKKYRRQVQRRAFYQSRAAEEAKDKSDEYDLEVEAATHEMMQRQYDAREVEVSHVAQAQSAFEAAQEKAAKADAERERKAQERVDVLKREEEDRNKAKAATTAAGGVSAVRQGVPLAQLTHGELSAIDDEYQRTLAAEREGYMCPFYLKTGSCRYGAQCGKKHPYPPVSHTVMIRNMYDGPGMSEKLEEDAGDDLLHEEEDIYKSFTEFYTDALPGFERFGKMLMFRVARNNAPHLRGNVYAHFERIEDAVTAMAGLNGRFYGGKKLVGEFVPVTKWKSAVCGLADRNACPRGKLCNFLHVFRNPNGAFPLFDHAGDRTLAGPVDPSGGGGEERRDRYTSSFSNGGGDRRRGDESRRDDRRQNDRPRDRDARDRNRDRDYRDKDKDRDRDGRRDDRQDSHHRSSSSSSRREGDDRRRGESEGHQRAAPQNERRDEIRPPDVLK